MWLWGNGNVRSQRDETCFQMRQVCTKWPQSLMDWKKKLTLWERKFHCHGFTFGAGISDPWLDFAVVKKRPQGTQNTFSSEPKWWSLKWYIGLQCCKIWPLSLKQARGFHDWAKPFVISVKCLWCLVGIKKVSLFEIQIRKCLSHKKK